MPSTINADNGVVSGSSGVKTTADTSGVLALQSNGSTGLTLNTDLSVTFAGAQTLSAGTANGVTYLNGSKVLTSGSGLTFDGQYVSLGAGLSSPNGLKFLANGGGLAANLTVNHSTGEIQNFATTNYFPTWYANNSEAARISTAGNFGIGTSSPAAKLHVVGTVRSANGAGTVFSSLATDGVYATGTDLYLLAPTGYSTIIYANNSEKFRVGTAGQFGIGGANYGTSGQVLTSGGSGAAPTWSSPAAGGFANMAVFTSSGTWTIPSGVTKCKVTVTGGGGGGGSAYAGGAGGTAIGVVTLSGSTATITVGSGGAANASGYAGTSSFVNSSTTLSGTGGRNGNTGSGYSPADGGYGSGGDINFSGGTGSASGYGPAGAASYWGGGAGTSGSPYGAGGAYYSAGTGSGGGGIVVIEY